MSLPFSVPWPKMKVSALLYPTGYRCTARIALGRTFGLGPSSRRLDNRVQDGVGGRGRVVKNETGMLEKEQISEKNTNQSGLNAKCYILVDFFDLGLLWSSECPLVTIFHNIKITIYNLKYKQIFFSNLYSWSFFAPMRIISNYFISFLDVDFYVSLDHLRISP